MLTGLHPQIYTTFPTSFDISYIFYNQYPVKAFKVCEVAGLLRVERAAFAVYQPGFWVGDHTTVRSGTTK